METTALEKLFDEIKRLTLWRRLFSWAAFRILSYEALEDCTKLREAFRNANGQLEALKKEQDLFTVKKNHAEEQLQTLRADLVKREESIGHLQRETARLEQEKGELRRRLQALEHTEQMRVKEHDERIAQASAIQKSFEKRLTELQDEAVRKAEEFARQQKETWRTHEEVTRNTFRGICDRNGIEHVNDVPVKGKPDMAVRICGEIVIFDAKSPASDDLSNFNTYLRVQAESVSKYLTDESIRREIYLVVPSNTATVIQRFIHNMGQYTVFVVTLDALEPLLVHLKKLETYEFAEQLSPEERQSICRVIGSFIHASKRRIQIDQFFNGQLLDLIEQARLDIPETMQNDILENERARKLNPPPDKRLKDIQTSELAKRQILLQGKATLHEIIGVNNLEIKEAY